MYQLPFGTNRKYRTGSRAVDHVIGDWQFNGILTFTSGLPYDVGASGDIANTGMASCCTYGYERLNLVGNPTPTNQSAGHWLNSSAFAVPAPIHSATWAGTLCALTGTRTATCRCSGIPFTETKKLEFRFEVLNFMNAPTWSIPDQTYSDPTFGQALSAKHRAAAAVCTQAVLLGREASTLNKPSSFPRKRESTNVGPCPSPRFHGAPGSRGQRHL